MCPDLSVRSYALCVIYDKIMNIRRTYIPLAFACAVLSGCEKEIEVRYDDISPVLVVEADVTSSGSRALLTLTTPMDEPVDKTPVTDATVSLSDLTTGSSVILQPGDDGVYRDGRGGIEGHEYRIEVSRGGERHTSVCVMQPPAVIASAVFIWKKMPYDYVAVLDVRIVDDVSRAGEYFWVRVYRNGEFYKWATVDDSLTHEGCMSVSMFTSREDLDEEEPGEALTPDDIVTVSVTPLSRTLYDYVNALGTVSNGVRLFEGGFCLGYFIAAPVTEMSVPFTPRQ